MDSVLGAAKGLSLTETGSEKGTSAEAAAARPSAGGRRATSRLHPSIKEPSRRAS